MSGPEPGSISPTPQHGKHRAGMILRGHQLVSDIEDKLPPEQFAGIAALLEKLKALANQPPPTKEHSTSSSDVTAKIALCSSMSDPELGSISPTPQYCKDRAALLADVVAVANRPPLRKMYYMQLRTGKMLTREDSHFLKAAAIRFLVENFGRNGKYRFVNNYLEIDFGVSLCMFSEDEFKIVKGKEPEEVVKVALLETMDLDSRYRLYHHSGNLPQVRVIEDVNTWIAKSNARMAGGCYDLPPLYFPKSSFDIPLPIMSYTPL